MNLEHLRYFVALEEHGSISSAAQHLFITNQGLGRALKAMETELGAPLVERDRKGVYLTRYGKTFLAAAKEILETYDGALRHISNGDPDTRNEKPLFLITSYIMESSTVSFANNGILQRVCIEECSMRDIYEKLRKGNGNVLGSCALTNDEYDFVSTRGEFVFEETRKSHLGILLKKDARAPEGLALSDILGENATVAYTNRFLDNVYSKVVPGFSSMSLLFKTSSSRTVVDCVLRKSCIGIIDSFSFLTHSMYIPATMEKCLFIPLECDSSSFHVGQLYYAKADLSPQLAQLVQDTIRAYNDFKPQQAMSQTSFI
jgi:molybdenum-dependent DNA-binding transcriptional regulator ModE